MEDSPSAVDEQCCALGSFAGLWLFDQDIAVCGVELKSRDLAVHVDSDVHPSKLILKLAEQKLKKLTSICTSNFINSFDENLKTVSNYNKE
jgi:hypothetical protein